MQAATRIQNTTYKLLGLSSGVSYYFAVRAENSHGVSGPSQLSEPITMGVVRNEMKNPFLHLISFRCLCRFFFISSWDELGMESNEMFRNIAGVLRF